VSLERHKLTLASGSPRRAQILSEAGFEFDVAPAEIDEDAFLVDTRDFSNAVQKLALAKAESIAVRRSGAYVLGADTIVVLDGAVLGKPESAEHAHAMLRSLSGKSHDVITGVAIINPVGETHTNYVRTSVIFRSLDGDEISKYVSTGSSFDKAGGYGIQDGSFAPVASYDECYLNVVGLPMCATSELLEQSRFVLSGVVNCAGHTALNSDHPASGSDKSRSQ
jgi:MAF protein